jgi:hypothetical protein
MSSIFMPLRSRIFRVAETRHQNRAQRVDRELAGQPFADFDVEQQHMHGFDRRTHGCHDQSADDADQGRKHDQAGLMGTNERPQPAWGLNKTRGRDHYV